MRPKKIANKASIGAKVIKEDGILAFSIKSLLYIQKKTDRKRRINTKIPKHQISLKAKYDDVIKSGNSSNYPKWKGLKKTNLTINWIMPPPGKGSGGHLNIFRFIKYLEEHGDKCRIYLYADGGKAPISAIRAIMGDSYPKVNAKMEWLKDGQSMESADAIFCTSWETAYASKKSKIKAKRFYFVQDFEPYFYPIGSLYSLAENTYKFGFYGITAGGWLSKKLNQDYGMHTDHYDFGSDNTIYSYQNDKKRKEILFYVRPYTERRGFEMGILALDIFHKKHPQIIINLVGWDVSDYELPFEYKNLKTLEIAELNALYNKCSAALVLSYTNMSLLPLELLGSGTIPVVNDGDNNRLVSNNKFIAYSENNPQALSNKLSDIVSLKNGPEYAKLASESVKLKSWHESGDKFVKMVRRETQKDD